MVANGQRMAVEHYAPDGHPLCIPRAQGFISTDGLVFCGECACNDAWSQVGSWTATRSQAILKSVGWTPFQTDEWCGRCDRPINPHI